MLVHYLPALWHALWVTLVLSGLSIIFGSIMGVVVGAVSSLRSPVRYLARLYIELFLGLPVLVILIWLYYVLPYFGRQFAFDPFWTATLALSLSLSGFVAEVIEGGFKAIPRGQLEAAYMLGLDRFQAIRHIILPQAIGIMWPALVVQYITTYKFSTLASVIGVNEILHIGSQIIQQTYRPIEVYTAIAFIFAATVYPLNLLARHLHSRMSRRDFLTGV
jgi:polar amino acid transport system permease protein